MLIDSGYFFNPIKRDIAMIQGDTCSFGFQLQGLQGQRPDSVILTCKETIEDDEALFEVSTSNTIDERSYDEERDILTYSVRIPPYCTHAIPLGRYFYDLQVVVNNDIFTLMTGRLSIEAQVTKTTAPKPAVEVGDNIIYPLDNIAPYERKAYTETKVNDIALSIMALLGEFAENGYNISDMSEAINEANEVYVAELAEDINDILETDDTYVLPTLINGVEGFKAYRDGIIDNSLTKIKTDAEVIRDYKFYNDDTLVTMEARSCRDIGVEAFSESSSFNKLILGESDSDRILFRMFSFRNSTNLHKVVIDNNEYIGSVNNIPFTNITIAGGSSVPASEVDFKDGDLIFNSTDYKLYVYNSGSWEVFVPTQKASAAQDFLNNCSLQVMPFIFDNVIIRTTALSELKYAFRACRLNNVYLDPAIFSGTSSEVGNILTSMFQNANSLKKVFVVNDGVASEDLGLAVSYLGEYTFRGTGLYSIDWSITATGSGSFRESGLRYVDLPKITSLYAGTFYGCGNLEVCRLGDGTGDITFGSQHNDGQFQYCEYLIEVWINTVNMATCGKDAKTVIFKNSPIGNYLGTTTTEIVEGATASNVTIDGVSVATTNGNIVSYNGIDYIRSSNKWAIWGNTGATTPKIRVPSALIPTYKAAQYWSSLSPEIWQAI